MEALKMILVVALCLLVTIIVSLYLRPEPCTHTSVCTHPDPGFVTMAEFQAVNTANHSLRKAQQKNNKAVLDSVTALGKSIIENRELIQTQQGHMQMMADGMVKLIKTLQTAAEAGVK